MHDPAERQSKGEPSLDSRFIDLRDLTQCEAASRIIIDAWLLQSMHLIEKMHNAHAVLFPELLVWSRNSQSDDPPAVKFNNGVTYLAGSVDYGSLSILPEKAISKAREFLTQPFHASVIIGCDYPY